jgi:hypothetical protein
MYIAVLEDVPDFITPTLVAHAVLGAHLVFGDNPLYQTWLKDSFKKCVVRVNQREFDKIAAIPGVYLGHENETLDGIKCCAIPIPCHDTDLQNVLKFSKLWRSLVPDNKSIEQERDRYKEALEEILSRHIPDQPAALGYDELSWAQMHVGTLRGIARKALEQR